MNKPQGYDEAQATGTWQPIQTGGHYMTIKKVTETKSKDGKDMIVVEFDFAGNDVQPGYFDNEYKNNTKPDKKWAFLGTAWIMVNDYNDPSKTSKKFKTFITCVERSNKGFEVEWGGNNWEQQFTNRNIGGVFGLVENEYNGNTSMRSQLRWFCSTDSVATAKVPDDLLLDASKTSMPNNFASTPDLDDVPF